MEMLKQAAIGVESDGKRGSVVECGPLSVTIYDSYMQGECRGPDKVEIK